MQKFTTVAPSLCAQVRRNDENQIYNTVLLSSMFYVHFSPPYFDHFNQSKMIHWALTPKTHFPEFSATKMFRLPVMDKKIFFLSLRFLKVKKMIPGCVWPAESRKLLIF